MEEIKAVGEDKPELIMRDAESGLGSGLLHTISHSFGAKLKMSGGLLVRFKWVGIIFADTCDTKGGHLPTIQLCQGKEYGDHTSPMINSVFDMVNTVSVRKPSQTMRT